MIDYVSVMKRLGSANVLLTAALGTVALAAATGLAFAGWMDHGPGIFMALAESGLAWCF